MTSTVGHSINVLVHSGSTRGEVELIYVVSSINGFAYDMNQQCQ